MKNILESVKIKTNEAEIDFYPIKRFEDYLISKCGKIYSPKSNKILKCRPNKDGYLMIMICSKGKKYFLPIHRLIAINFIPNKENKPCVNHIDADRQNNEIKNLEWCSVLENNQHTWRCGRGVNGGPERVKMIKLLLSKRVNQYDLNGVLIKEWSGIREVERVLSIDSSSIAKVCKGRENRSQCGGFIWKFAS